ncbi:MAG: mannitol dehydrogenase family protein [Opitutales bacterium]
MKLQKTKYNKDNIKAGIAHIGVGNFHRAHQAYYTNLILEDDSQQNWALCGIALLEYDAKLVESLKSQNFNYNLLVCGRDGVNEAYEINAIKEVLHNDSQAILDKLASPEIKIISMTITEGGYNLDKATGEFNLDNPQVKADLENPQSPKTVFGYVAQALRMRMQNGAGAVTILSCDNLQHNGNTAKRVFSSFIKAQDENLYAWTADNVSFPNSMVDRITPAVREEDRQKINAEIGVEDLAPIYCEDFIQWVIEDNFIAGRPAWEKLGVEFTDDVSSYENMKLSLLNASHTLLSYPSFLAGYRKVDDAMSDPIIINFVKEFMDIDITPYVPAPRNIDLEVYKQTLVERFANHTVSDQIARLCFDGISKFPVYIMPNLAKMLKDKAQLKRLAFLFACYRRYLALHIDDNGVDFEVQEPQLSEADKTIIAENDDLGFLKLSAFNAIDLAEYKEFVDLYLVMYKKVCENKILDILKDL